MWFNYTMEYKLGHDNVIADCLSHLPLPVCDQLELGKDMIVTTDQLQTAYRECPVMQQVTKLHLHKGWLCTSKGLDQPCYPSTAYAQSWLRWMAIWFEVLTVLSFLLRYKHNSCSWPTILTKG